MSLTRIFACDLCHESRDQALMVGLFYCEQNRTMKVCNPVDTGQHVCTRCVAFLQSLPPFVQTTLAKPIDPE